MAIYVTDKEIALGTPSKKQNGKLFEIEVDFEDTFGGSITDAKGFLFRLGRARHLAHKVRVQDGLAYVPSGGTVYGARETRMTAFYTVDRKLCCHQHKLNRLGKYEQVGPCPDDEAFAMDVNGVTFRACKHVLAVMLSGVRGTPVMFKVSAPELPYNNELFGPDEMIQIGTGQQVEQSAVQYNYDRKGFDKKGIIVTRRLPKRAVTTAAQ